MILSDLQGRLLIASLFKWYFAYLCSAINKILTDSASRGPSAISELLVKVTRGLSTWFADHLHVAYMLIRRHDSINC